jgi:preprotein translocase SecE subunit
MAGNNQQKKATEKTSEDGAMKRLGKFLKESYTETRFKTTWPTKDELKHLTAVVLMAVILSGLYFGGLDAIYGVIIRKIAHL